MKSIIWDSMMITSPATVPIRFLLTDFRRAISLSSTAFLALAFLVSMLALQLGFDTKGFLSHHSRSVLVPTENFENGLNSNSFRSFRNCQAGINRSAEG